MLVLVFVVAASVTAADEVRPDAEALARLGFLRDELARHDALYFREARPEITDAEYDELKREFTALQAQFPTESARSDRVGAKRGSDDRMTGFPKARHRLPMLSLVKSHTEGEVASFVAGVQAREAGRPVALVVEPKYDGLAASVIYVDGKLDRIVTRGDGEEGDVVTINARLIGNLPNELRRDGGEAPPTFFEARGEVYLTFAEFARLNAEREQEGLPPYASPRNLAAGTLKSLEPSAPEARRLEIVFFGAGEITPATLRPDSQTHLLGQFERWGLPTPIHRVTADSANEVWRAVQRIGRERAQYPFPTDGAVIKVDAVDAQERLGASDEAPRWAVAYKFAPERARTRLRSITWQVGRTGQITPVGELEPVRLGGARVTRVTLHNAAEITRRDLRVGDFVFVERGGEIIPKIVGVDLAVRETGSEPYAMPIECPSCHHPLAAGGHDLAWRCEQVRCPAQVKARIRHLASPAALGIKGLGESTVAALVESGKVQDIAGLFRLTRADLVATTRLGASAADSLVAAIARSRTAALWRWLHGIGLPEVGASAAKTLARAGIDLATLAVIDAGELRRRTDWTEAKAEALVAAVQRPEFLQLLGELRALGVEPDAIPIP